MVFLCFCQQNDHKRARIYKTLLLNGPNNLVLHDTCWKGLPRTNTSLLGPLVSYKENEML